MDPGLFSLHTCVKLVLVVLYLLGSARCSATVESSSCLCRDIPLLPNTQPPTQSCTQSSKTFRYKCIDGYVRKAGTSNLIKCNDMQKWSTATLSCIRDPLAPSTTTTISTTTRSTSSPMTPTTDFLSSMSTETEPTSAVIPLLHTSGPPLENTTLPQPSTNTPSPSSQVSTSSPVSSGRVHSTSTRSPSTSTHHTPSPSSQVSTSSPVSSGRVHSTSTRSPSTSTHRTSQLDRTTSTRLSPSLNSTSSTFEGLNSVATNVVVPVMLGLIVLLFGVGWFLYRRRSRNNTPENHTQGQIAEEKILMHQTNEDSIKHNDIKRPLKDS